MWTECDLKHRYFNNFSRKGQRFKAVNYRIQYKKSFLEEKQAMNSDWSVIFFIDFLDYRLGLFIEEKPICTKKNVGHCLPWKVWLPTSTLPVQLRDFCFWITEWFDPQSIQLVFGLREQIPSGSHHTNFWLLFYFYGKYPPIWMLLGLKHNKIKFQT
jgi:hypothetical protein